ncbi:MAG: hypothetical protein ACE5KK_08120 [Candidatus Brocadiales bacterium]
MEMNLDPGWDKMIINLRGPCKLDVTTRDESTVAAVEVPSGEEYRLVVTRSDKKPESFVAEATNVILNK